MLTGPPPKFHGTRDILQGPWLDGAVAALDEKHLRQFWYNQLLAQIAAKQGGYAEFVGVVVACEADAEARGARREVRAQLKPEHRGTLKFSSIEDVVESVALPGDWEKRFTERYLDFSPIRRQLPPEDPRRLALPH